MSDFEKVLKGLECCTTAMGCKACPYSEKGIGTDDCQLESTQDALELLKTRQWISVKDRLPDYRKWVLCRCRAEIYEVMRFNFNDGPTWYHDDGHEYLLGFVTHWMPLPEPPKED